MQVSTVREAISALEEVYNTKNNNIPKYLFVTSTYEGKTTITAPVRLTKESKEEILNMYEAAEEMEEGKENKEWILVDYFDVVVHVFRKSRREFFKLEKLWGDGIIKEIPNLI